MSRILYADTGAFIALLYGRDRAHRVVSDHLRRLAAAGDRLITGEPVISETVTRLRHDAGLARVAAFRAVLFSAIAQGSLSVRESDESLRRSAFDVLERFADLRLSYADAAGAAIAREARIETVFGLDNDFRVLGFRLEP